MCVYVLLCMYVQYSLWVGMYVCTKGVHGYIFSYPYPTHTHQPRTHTHPYPDPYTHRVKWYSYIPSHKLGAALVQYVSKHCILLENNANLSKWIFQASSSSHNCINMIRNQSRSTFLINSSSRWEISFAGAARCWSWKQFTNNFCHSRKLRCILLEEQ